MNEFGYRTEDPYEIAQPIKERRLLINEQQNIHTNTYTNWLNTHIYIYNYHRILIIVILWYSNIYYYLSSFWYSIHNQITSSVYDTWFYTKQLFGKTTTLFRNQFFVIRTEPKPFRKLKPFRKPKPFRKLKPFRKP